MLRNSMFSSLQAGQRLQAQAVAGTSVRNPIARTRTKFSEGCIELFTQLSISRRGVRTCSTSAASESQPGSSPSDAASTTLSSPASHAADAPSTSSAANSAPTEDPAPTVSSATAAPSGVSLLASSEPIDRLRYQALLIFQHFDTENTGRLSSTQLQQFFTWSLRKESWNPGLSEVLQQVQATFSQLAATGCSQEDFTRIIRAQVHAVSTSPAYQSSMMRADVAARLQAQMSLNRQELAAARWMFGLLDFDNDGKVGLDMYSKAEGIEAYVYEDKIEDADADADGKIVFEEFLVSYARPKPIGKNLVIMAVNTLIIYLILQAPVLDIMMKVLLVGVLMLRPQLVSKPAALVYDAIKAVIDQGKAQAELAKANRGVWRPA